MNVLCVTGNLSNADYLEHELGKIAPQIHIDVSPGIDDALARLSVAGRYDTVLLDPVVNGADGEGLITHIRQQNLPVAVVVLSGPTDDDPPLRLLHAGADDYLVRKPNFVRDLPALLERILERRTSVNEQEVHPVEVLHTGDIQAMRRCFRHSPSVKLQSANVDSDGRCVLPSAVSGKFPYDAAVLDDIAHGPRILDALKELLARAADTPVILLISPGREAMASQALKLGAAGCVVKTGDYLPSLAATVENGICRRDLARERAAMRATEARLRLIIETIPACVTRLAPDGTFQAMNWTGLAMLGATRLDQVVGRNLYAMAGPEQEEHLREFLVKVGGGEHSSIEFDLDGLDGINRKLELRAVPLGLELADGRAILGVIRQIGAPSGDENAAAAAEAAELKRLRGEWEATQQHWEEERNKLEAGRQAELEQQLRDERSQWENTSLELKRRCSEAEERCAELADQRDAQEQKLRALDAHCAELEAQARAAQAEGEGIRQETDLQHGPLMAMMCELEMARSELEQRYQDERSQWEAARQELERCRAQADDRRMELEIRNVELERQHSELELALQMCESSRSHLEEQYRTGQGEWEKYRRESEQRQVARGDDAHALDALKLDLEEQHRRERAEWDSALQALKRQCTESEAKRAEIAGRNILLAKALQAVETRHAALQNQQRSEQAEWDKKAQEFEQQRLSLEEAYRELQARQAALEHQHKNERAEWEKLGRKSELERAEAERRQSELEKRRAVVEQGLRNLELRCAQLGEQYRSELARQDLKEQRDDAERRRKDLEEAVRGFEARFSEIQQVHSSEKAAWEHSCEELKSNHSEQIAGLESRSTTLQASLSALETQYKELDATYQAEKEEYGRKFQEFTELQAEMAGRNENLEKTLAALELYQKELLEKQFSAGINHTLKDELERQRAARVSMEEMLRVSEARRRELEECQKAERAQWQSAREEHERQRTATVALEEDLRSLELRLTQLVEEHRGERVELEAARQELNRQRTARLALEEALRGAEERLRAGTFAELAPAAGQAVVELVTGIRGCTEMLAQSLGPDDPCRIRAARLLESANQTGKLALRLLALGPGAGDSSMPKADSAASG